MSGIRIDPTKASCRTKYADQAHLWDEDLDGNGLRRAETVHQRRRRHQKAKTICMGCEAQALCLALGRTDPFARGIYGGALVRSRS